MFELIFKEILFYTVLLITTTVGQDNEPSLPSHLPSPPPSAPSAPSVPSAPAPSAPSVSSPSVGFSHPQDFDLDFEVPSDFNFDSDGFNNNDPHHHHSPQGHRPGLGSGPNNIFAGIPNEVPPQNTPNGPFLPGSPDSLPPVIFGLNHIILILVPQFKAKVLNLPKWFGSNVKVSLPMTVFFDKLTYPDIPPGGPIPPSPYQGPFFPNGHFVKKRSVSDTKDRNSGSRRKTRKRPSMNGAIYGAERVMLIPRLEKLLQSFGLGGRPCLLRAICEVHEVPLHQNGYGLLGEVLTLFFSISNSAFADSHLRQYLTAEQYGKQGDCSMYYKGCSSSLFYWEKSKNFEEYRKGLSGTDKEEVDEMLKHFP